MAAITAFTIGLSSLPKVSADQPQAGFRGSSSGGASTGEAFITVSNTAGLSAERALATAAAARISITDGGANGSITLDTGTNIPLINAGNSWSAAQIPSAFGTIDLGSTTRPWRDLYLAPNAGSFYQKVTSVATANRTVTLPDANSNTIIPDTGSANNFLTAISSGGVISKAQPTFSNISGTATAAQGGTGVNGSGATNGQLLIGNGSGYSLATLTQGSGVTITNGAGSITIAASGGGFTIATKTSSFTASDGGGYYYRMTTNDQTVTLPASPADGSVRKFKMVTANKTATFAFNGAETINHADGTSDQSLTLTSTGGVLELVAVSGGWDET